jgi:hypothetical protein
MLPFQSKHNRKHLVQGETMVAPRNISFNILDLDSLCEVMFQLVAKVDGLPMVEHMKNTGVQRYGSNNHCRWF